MPKNTEDASPSLTTTLASLNLVTPIPVNQVTQPRASAENKIWDATSCVTQNPYACSIPETIESMKSNPPLTGLPPTTVASLKTAVAP